MAETDKLPISTSQPPIFPPEQTALFREVLELMNLHKVPYSVSGAFALQQHTGICRDTKDLDLFVPPADVDHALAILRDDGFEVEITDPVWLAKAKRGDFFVDLITGMSNGVIRVDRSWIDRSTPAEIVGIKTHVLGPEELIASKVFVAFRERFDGADIAHVIYGTQGKLDWERMISLMNGHEDLLFWSLAFFRYAYPKHVGFVPQEIWARLIGRLQADVANPAPDAAFRGNLLDERMFAIDVKEWGLEDTLTQYRALHEPIAKAA